MKWSEVIARELHVMADIQGRLDRLKGKVDTAVTRFRSLMVAIEKVEKDEEAEGIREVRQADAKASEGAPERSTPAKVPRPRLPKSRR